ncbi:MAG: Coq4 family protein [Myxococcota bacterium]
MSSVQPTLSLTPAAAAPPVASDAPLEVGPPLPNRPIAWRDTARGLARLLSNPERTESVFELMRAIGGRGSEPTFQAFRSIGGSGRLLHHAPDLIAALADRDSLARLPEGSLGRGYLAFAERNHVSADGLIQARDNTGLRELQPSLDPARAWFFDRLNPIHDLWHVLTGYETDPVGEVGLLAFTIGQGCSDRTFKLLFAVAILRGSWKDRFAFHRFLWRAWRSGRRAQPLLALPYEELLRRPLEPRRDRLGIKRLALVHPHGVPAPVVSPQAATGAA